MSHWASAGGVVMSREGHEGAAGAEGLPVRWQPPTPSRPPIRGRHRFAAAAGSIARMPAFSAGGRFGQTHK